MLLLIAFLVTIRLDCNLRMPSAGCFGREQERDPLINQPRLHSPCLSDSQ